jgi:hypothetical protein
MANTEELLSLLEKQFVGWNRDGVRGIRYYLNVAQEILCAVEGDQLMIIEDSTGKLPSITTTTNIFAYDLPSTVNFIDSVLVEADVTTTLADNLWRQDYGRTTRSHRRASEEINISGVKYLRIPFVRSFPANGSVVAKVVFTEDPGSTSDVYRYRGYKKPTEVVSDTIALTIHPPYDMTCLFPATALLMQGAQNGNYYEAIQTIEKVYKPQMHQAFNQGAFGIYHEAEDHGF